MKTVLGLVSLGMLNKAHMDFGDGLVIRYLHLTLAVG